MRKCLSAVILIVLLISVPIVSALGNTWDEDFTTDNIRTTGSYSYDYWLNVSDSTEANASFAYSVSNGILTLIASKTGTLSNDQQHTFVRLLDISGDTIIEIKFCFESSQILETYVWYYASNETTSEIIGIRLTPTKHFSVLYRNITKDLETYDFGVLSANQWYIARIDYTEIPVKYNVTLTYPNGTTIDNVEITNAYYPLSAVYKVAIHQGMFKSASDGYCRFYFDYIDHSSTYAYNDIINAFIPVIVTIAMISLALGFIKKVGD